jgi:hypothetical protein
MLQQKRFIESKSYRIITAVLWLALPVIGLQYWMVWDQLPARMASHFGTAGQPNGWMTRETSVIFSLVLLVFLLATFTFVLARIRKPDALAWSLLAMFYVVTGVLVSVTSSVLEYNIHGSPLNIVPEMVVTFLAAFVVIGVALSAKRGPELPRQVASPQIGIGSEEVHASFVWAIVFAVMTAVELGLVAIIPVGGLRLVMALPALLLLGVTALAWSGFHYRFSSHGVEISTLGFRLRSIPLESIRAYAIAPWNAMGGYGIRGIGERRAYVWCNTGVRIMLSDGEVFLGHQNPEKIMNDLNSIRQHQKARENT